LTTNLRHFEIMVWDRIELLACFFDEYANRSCLVIQEQNCVFAHLVCFLVCFLVLHNQKQRTGCPMRWKNDCNKGTCICSQSTIF
jgi:hypothetical protein